MSPKPGEVWLADLGLAGKTRPVLIISREDPNPPRVLVIYIPLTTQNRGSRYEVEVGKLPFRLQHDLPGLEGSGALYLASMRYTWPASPWRPWASPS